MKRQIALLLLTIVSGAAGCLGVDESTHDDGLEAASLDEAVGGRDECNSTSDCRAAYGSRATDCVDSRSDQSWCECGSARCSDAGGGGADPEPPPPPSSDLYTQSGTDRTWAQILSANAIPIGVNSTAGITGSTINVNNPLVELASYGNRSPDTNIKIHTVGNSSIRPGDFGKWSRWYQQDGRTQVFRLFKGETNVRNTRLGAARIEAFSDVRFRRGGGWYEWTGRYTIVKPLGSSIFQSKNSVHDWGIMINLTNSGDVVLNHRRHKSDITIARNMTGKSFELRVRDNGHEYEVYLDGEFQDRGHYDRPTEDTVFRWGMYKGGEGAVTHDALIFVSGAKVRKE